MGPAAAVENAPGGHRAPPGHIWVWETIKCQVDPGREQVRRLESHSGKTEQEKGSLEVLTAHQEHCSHDSALGMGGGAAFLVTKRVRDSNSQWPHRVRRVQMPWPLMSPLPIPCGVVCLGYPRRRRGPCSFPRGHARDLTELRWSSFLWDTHLWSWSSQ